MTFSRLPIHSQRASSSTCILLSLGIENGGAKLVHGSGGLVLLRAV
jgi:hypothetical protein